MEITPNSFIKYFLLFYQIYVYIYIYICVNTKSIIIRFHSRYNILSYFYNIPILKYIYKLNS